MSVDTNTTMATKRLKRPRDPIALAKLIGDIATGQIEDHAEDKRDPVAVKMGGKGGRARAGNLTKERRSEIARKAALKRWGKGPVARGKKEPA